jgi:DNA polymerase III sliding clamp (beta) subunit (PCNA family)
MRIQRQEFLDSLEMVKAGLAPREFVEQSSCFAFKDGEVMTFNDEVACRKPIGINVTGAVQAQALLDILSKMEDDVLEVSENEQKQLEFQGKRKSFAVTKDTEIFLPIDRVENPKKWHKLPKEFIEAVGLVQHCVSKDESHFMLTCIHLARNFVESCDNHQLIRVALDNEQFEEPALVRGASLAHLTTLAMDQVAKTENWVHFKNQDGLVYSCRRYAESYPSLDDALKVKGHNITIPKGLVEASDRAAVFASDRVGDPLVSVTLKSGALRIVGEGAAGWYKEFKKVDYNGPKLEFLVAPDLLKHISEEYRTAVISQDKLKAAGGSWEYVTVLGKTSDEGEEPQEKKSKRSKQEEEE